VVAASALMGAAMALAAQRLDWLALGRHEGRRALAMALALGAAALLYFGALRVAGLDWRALMRKSARESRLAP